MLYNILVIEDNVTVSKLICQTLRKNPNFNIQQVDKIKWARKAIKKTLFDLICLDILLPDENGLDFCKEIKKDENFKNTKIIVISQRTNTLTKIESFNIGADEYITKPFHPQELDIRVKKQLGLIERRSFNIKFRHFELETKGQVFKCEKYEIPLSTTEFLIMKHLFENNGCVKTDTLGRFLSSQKFLHINHKTVVVAMSRLKRKLRKNTGRSFIKNRYGVGYYFP